MQAKALLSGLGNYAKNLVAVVVFPLAWLQAGRLAGRHKEDDPRGRAKVAVAALAGVALLAGAYLLVSGFVDGARDGIYESLDTGKDGLARAMGESEYRDSQTAVEAKTGSIATIEGKLEEARQAGDQAAVDVLEAALETARADRAKNEARVAELSPNHLLYNEVHAALQDHDDARAKQLIANAPFDYGKMESLSARAFEIKDKAVADMDRMMLWFVWPGLIGLLHAPLILVESSILKHAFKPSDTVGFRPYPGGAMALLLAFGAFGVPAAFLAAWAYKDMEGRSLEGQIAL